MAQDWWLPPRDYVGYGVEPPKVLWPGNKVIAVSFVLNYEEGAESTPWNGDDRSCNSLHELHYSRPATSGGQRDGLVEDMVSATILHNEGAWLNLLHSSNGVSGKDFRA
jgi:hypothetical protein